MSLIQEINCLTGEVTVYEIPDEETISELVEEIIETPTE